MLLANAGSGKTYALTTRIIRLILLGATADRIAALTFTRKSAGEFLDELLKRLAESALDPTKLSELQAAVEYPALSSSKCAEILQHLIENFGQLSLGTIDSFFGRIAKQFPLESGLPEKFAIADNASLASARERVLAISFSKDVKDHYSLEAMVEQCRQISRKRAERNVFGTLLDQVERLHQRFLESPQQCVWGDPARIWRDHPRPFPMATDLQRAIDQFESAALNSRSDFSEEAIDYLKNHLDQLRELQPGQAWSKETQAFIERKLSSEPKNNQVRLTPKKTGWLELTEPVRTTRKQLLDSLYADALTQILDRSQGLYAFVSDFESAYSEIVRDTGLISFADITALLAARAEDICEGEAIDWRNQVAYRIDQRFDHWLLDEFQDTSRIQWTILRAFIEEVLMDASAERSFFYVGDTKQAIYGWRGGEAELFHEIYDYYDSIEEAQPLIESWRSTVPIITLVNQLFGTIPAFAETLGLPEQTSSKWVQSWNSHRVASPMQDRVGYAQWQPIDKDPDADTPVQHTEVLRILLETTPIEHGIDCAILVRKNKDAADLAAFLQSQGIAVSVEGKSNPCTDNLLGSGILALLRATAHPEDRLATAIAQGLPLAESLRIQDFDTFRESALSQISEFGYAKTIQDWLQELALSDGEAFLSERGEAFLSAAENYDNRLTGDLGIDSFIQFIESLEAQESANADTIRIMTIHQSKGLEFEMTIVCGLDQTGAPSTTNELVSGPNPHNPEWALLMPRKDLAEQDPLLRSLNEGLLAEAKTSELCTNYVALTRAKRALYVVSERIEEKSRIKNFGKHLQLALGDKWAKGDPKWFNRNYANGL